jgi:hypothetical protein
VLVTEADKIARLVAALEFYANPCGRKDEHGEPVPVPDFYSELEFGGVAEAALQEWRGPCRS